MLAYRHLRLASSPGAEIRSAVFEGKDHLVIPVVALIGDSVVWSATAPGPELVPAEVIERSAIEWNGRPVVGPHPKEGDQYVSANSPSTYESTCFGRIANSRYEKNKLVMEAWLDPEKAKKVGSDAVKVIERAQAKETIEVSVGAYVQIEQRNGTTADGKKYVGVWDDIGSDHLALLPEGEIGACSCDMGCGGPRVAKSKVNTGANLPLNHPVLRAAKEDEVNGNGNGKNKTNVTQRLMESLAKAFGFRSALEDGVSDVELRDALYKALRAIEPGFAWIDDVYPDTSTVVYTTYPEDKLLYFRRTFVVAEDGSVTLNDDREQVVLRKSYEAITAAEDGSITQPISDGDWLVPANAIETLKTLLSQHDCGCGGSKNKNESTQPGQSAQGGSMNVQEKKDLIGRLILSAANPFVEKDRKVLETLSDEQLTALDTGFKSAAADPSENPAGDQGVKTPPAAPVEPTPSPNPPVKAVETIDAEELQTLRSLAAESTARKQKRHGELVTLLKSNQTHHNEAALKALSLDRLEELTAILKLEEPRADYSGARVAISSENIPELPDTYGLYKKSTQKEVSN